MMSATMKTRTLTASNKAEYNPRKISKRRLVMLRDSLREFGDLSGFIFNRRSNKLVGGHQRLKSWDDTARVTITNSLKEPDRVGTVAYGFVEMDGTRYAYREVDWDANRERSANIAANKHGGEFDDALLAEVVKQLDTNKAESAAIGFEADELAELLSPAKDKGNGEIVYEQAVQLRPQMEYVIIACDTPEQFDALRKRLGLGVVRRGGYKKGSDWDDIGVERVIKYERFANLISKSR